MIVWLLTCTALAFDPDAKIYKVYTLDTFRIPYSYAAEPWVMEDFVAKLNKKCADENLGFQYEVVQEADPTPWDKPDPSKYAANIENFDAVISNPIGPLMQFAVVPYFMQANSKVPLIAAGVGNSVAHFPNPPPNMFFPTPTVSAVYDELIRMFVAQGFKKHVMVSRSCHQIGFIAPLVEAKKKEWFGEENYYCVNPRNATCDEIQNANNSTGGEFDLCLRPFEEVIAEIGDADVVEFFEYVFMMPLVYYMDEKKINYKAKIFFSQLPFQDEDLDIALYGLIEQRGFSEDASYHQNYDDGNNRLGIFAAQGNKTSQKVFNEWFNSHNSKMLKLSVISEIAGWYYLHENILRARKAKSTDLSATMRNGVFIPSIIGMIGTGPSQKNDQVSKPLWLQVLPDVENDKKPRRRVMYPLEIAQVYSYHPMVVYDDRECYPDCPDCYGNICEQMATLLFISLIGLCGILSLAVLVALCVVTRRYRMKALLNVWVPLYSIFEMIACITAITSIHSIRKSKDTQHSIVNWALTFFSGFDGFTAVVRGGNWISEITVGLPIIPHNAFYWLEVVDCFFILIGSGVYFLYIVSSTVETKSSAPQIIDITLNLIEVVLFVFGSAMADQLSSIRDTFDNKYESNGRSTFDEESEDSRA